MSIGGEEEGSHKEPNFSFSRKNIVVDFKHLLIPLNSMHFGIGFDFGGAVKILSVSDEPYNFQ